MQIFLIQYDWYCSCVFIPEQEKIVGISTWWNEQEFPTYSNDIEEAKQLYFYEFIQGHWCDRTSDYEDHKDLIYVKEINL